MLALAALFVGYCCSYFHRADLAALAPVWRGEAAHAALRAALPDIASLGMLVYAAGKLLGGWLADRFGGRRIFVAALAGAGVAEAFAVGAETPAAFAACRVGGMAVLGCAWPSVGHVAAAMTPRARLATTMAFLSQSYLLGDAAVRAVLAAVVAGGGGAHAVLRTSAFGLLAGAAAVGLALAIDARRRGVPSTASPRTAATAGPGGGALRTVVVALAVMNAAIAVVRESMALWAPALCVAAAGVGAADAVRASAWLPFASAAGALAAGWLADRGGRGVWWATVPPAAAAALALAALAHAGDVALPWLLGGLAFASAALAMPMSLASGVLPLRLAPTGGARRLGIVDGAGSFGAVLAGGAVGRALDVGGASAFCATLAASAAVATLLAALAWRLGGCSLRA
jgi:sugar phosphate permease